MDPEKYAKALRYSASQGDVKALLRELASNPEHQEPGSNLRMVAADAVQEQGDQHFADYLRSPHPLAVEGKNAYNTGGRVLRSSLRLHRLLSELHRRQGHGEPDDKPNPQDPLYEEAAKELERHGRDHEAGIVRSPHKIGYKGGVVRGTYPEFAWPGGAPIYHRTRDGGVLCPECRNGGNGSEAMHPETQAPHDGQWDTVITDVHEEGPPLHCDHCNKQIDALYGDPDNPEDE